MGAVIVLLAQALSILSSILGYVNGILSIVGTAAQEHAKFSIETIASNAANTVNSPAHGNAALLTAINAVNAQVVAAAASLTLQVTDLTDGTTPVSLPVVPPSGYAAPTSGAVASDVWNYSGYPLFAQAKNYLQAAGNWGAFSANLRWLGDEIKYFEAVYGIADYTAGAADWVPAFDPTDILVGEDALACLTRQNPGWTVGWAFAPSGYVRLAYPGTAEIQEWQSTFDQAGFAAIKAQLFPVSTASGAPVWPGIANVTLGTPVAIDRAVDITTPMDGILIHLTATPPDKPRYLIGSELAVAHIGQIAFLDDNGEMEYPQNLSFPHQVYCPTSMFSAAGVKLRSVPGVTGTITPWLLT